MKQNRNLKINKAIKEKKRGFRYITIKMKIALSVKMKLRISFWN